ncbi:Spore wall and anchoring disk complex protein EnP1 [Nosema granulosis]|uniref:Spore wall and anchoring disk complex protein EnP1 n=1 Tax=Nosema granulosis TaxID=83296 RepID=A0A9P6H0W8_9MICR|nr:Spore wall and anchoring disk complex protein EnP1 [Nosema granulosis]
MKIVLIQVLISLICGISVEIRKGRCNETPYSICKSNGPGVVATHFNIKYLQDMLKNNNIPNAYVYGWNDNKLVMVLYQNGALAPYDQYTNFSEYAFCAVECPCPADNVVSNCNGKEKDSCNQYNPLRPDIQCNPCASKTHHHNPCATGNHHDNPCATGNHHHNPCDSSSSSEETNKIRNPRCPIFVKQSESCNRTNKKCTNGKPYYTNSIFSNLKTFTIRKEKSGDYTIESVGEKNVFERRKYSVKKGDKSCEKADFPSVLCSPNKLKKKYELLRSNYKKPICLYVNDCNMIFALVDDVLCRVKKTRGHGGKRLLILEEVDEEIIQMGLYGVKFE